MTRNQTRRVEIACPVTSEELKKTLSDYLERLLGDNTKARKLQADGNYLPVVPGDGEPLNVQSYYMENPLVLQSSAVPQKSFRQRLKGFIRFGK